MPSAEEYLEPYAKELKSALLKERWADIGIDFEDD